MVTLLAMVPFSNNTIKRRIQEISEDILQQTIASVKRSGKFSLQLDETTDVGNDALLMVFMRYLDTNDYMEQLLFCRPLAKNTTREQIFKKVNSFFTKHQLKWSDCVPVCEDGAPSMMGCKKGFMSFVKKENKNISVVHCLLHRKNLATQEIQEDLAIVFKKVVSVVNFIKSRPLQLVYFVCCVMKWGLNTMGFCSISTFVVYREERYWREWLTHEMKSAPF